MNYYSELMRRLKGEEQVIDLEKYKIDNHKDLDSLQTKVANIQLQLDEAVQELADKKEELIASKYTPVTSKRYVNYTRTGTLYDWDTCSPVDSTDGVDNPIVVETNQVSNTVMFLVGYDLEQGTLVIGEYSFRVNTVKQKIHHRFIKQHVWSFIKGEYVRGNDGYWPNSFKSTQKDCKDFIKKFLDVDYNGRKDLHDLSSCFRRNKSFEIILREADENLVDKLLDLNLKEVTPMNKIFGLTRPNYLIAKDKGYLPTILYLKNNSIKIPENETEYLDFLEACTNAANDFEFYQIQGGTYYYGNNESPTTRVAKTILDNYNSGRNELIPKYYTLKKYYNYVFTEVVNQGYTSLNDFCSELGDYIRMCVSQEIKPTLFSSYLRQTHDVCSRNHKVVLKAEEETVFKKRYENWKDEKVNDKYFVVTPKTSDDLKREGDELNHCVASYIKRVIDGDCYIFFLREDKEKSLITFEVRGDKVCQVRGSHNRSPQPDEKKAISKWCEKHQIKYQ